LLSEAFTPTGTLPEPHATQVPPKYVDGLVELVVIYIEPTGHINLNIS